MSSCTGHPGIDPFSAATSGTAAALPPAWLPSDKPPNFPQGVGVILESVPNSALHRAGHAPWAAPAASQL